MGTPGSGRHRGLPLQTCGPADDGAAGSSVYTRIIVTSLLPGKPPSLCEMDLLSEARRERLTSDAVPAYEIPGKWSVGIVWYSRYFGSFQ